ncbi:MAG: M3 family oligoendopeptidase [Pirellulales bacterium]|nr:M3 family oligoendopeptidase [Pirellulales bacterium]
MQDLPRWNLQSIYPSLSSPEYTAARADYQNRLTALEAYFDQHDIRRLTTETSSAASQLGSELVEIMGQLQELSLQGETLGAYLYGLITTDSFDAAAAKENSQLEILGTRRQKLEVRLKGWLGSIAQRIPAILSSTPTLEPYRFFLEFNAAQSRYLMSEELESLAAELCLDAGTAFGRLQGNITSQLQVPWEENGQTRLLPIAQIHNFSFDPNPDIRRRAYQAEIAGWHSLRTTVAACLNGVKGTSITLARSRGRESPLTVALEQNRIDRDILEALLGAIDEALPMFRRYLLDKAKKLCHAGAMPWWDLFAPVGHAEQRFTWAEARAFIIEKFSVFSPELGEYARRAFDEQWIDAEPRLGKRGGAYCMPVPGVEESRILANYDGSFEQLMTLAHELGHGYHNECQKGLEMPRRGSPATLAETASIFCETLVATAALQTAPPGDQLAILETQLANAMQVCVDIRSRYLFETAIFERRASGELSPEEFCDLMRDAQARTYGEAVLPETYHQYMWLWKPHYYSHEEYFYNFPYAFGHLFGMGLYAYYQSAGETFIPQYRQLLRDTAQDWAGPLAGRFGINLADREFWRGSLAIIARLIEQYEKLSPT